MLTRYALAFTLVAGAAAAASLPAPDSLVRGRTTVAEVEQDLGAPMDTRMRPDGGLTLVYAYGRCARHMPAAFPSAHGSESNGRIVSMHFGPDFVFRSSSIITFTASTAEDAAPTNLASK